MITPESLRDAMIVNMNVEFSDDTEFGRAIRNPANFGPGMRLGLAKVLATGEMDFKDYFAITDDDANTRQEVLERLREIWDIAYPDLEPQAVLNDPSLIAPAT